MRRFSLFVFVLASVAFASLCCFVSSASASTINLRGTVSYIPSAGKFVYQTGAPYGYVSVFYSEGMVVPSGTQISVGQNVTVTGSFTRGQLSATVVTIASGSTGPYHIATLGYDNYWAQGETASAASVNLLLSYAQGNDKSLADCHSGTHSCKAVYYMDPNHVWNNTPSTCVYHPDAEEVAAASESWFVHDSGYTDAAHRVYGIDGSGCRIFELNPGSVGVQNWWSNYLRANADQYDVYFLDADQMSVVNEGYFPYGTGGGCLPWPSYCHSTQEIPNDAAEVAAHASFVNAMRHRNGSPMHFLFQQATLRNVPLDVSAFTASRNFMGMTCEGCVSTYSEIARPELYGSVLQEMAATNATSGAFMLTSHGNAPAGSATQILQRLVTTGIAWLGYSEGHTIVQPDLESNTNNLAVWPEDLIYPSSPVQSMLSGPLDLQVSSGVYRREFATCYQRGASIGPCGAVVNSTTAWVRISGTWLKQTYRHVILLSGGDVLSGGVANISGASFSPGLTSVQPGGALLLAP